MASRPEKPQANTKNLHLGAQAEQGSELPFSRPPRSGDACPRCSQGTLDYDGLLNLACQACGYSLAGCFT